MGGFADRMASLVQSMAASRRDCVLAVEGIKAQSADMMSAFGQAHAAIAGQLHTGLAAGCRGRARQVNAMRRSYREARQRMGEDLRQGLAGAVDQAAATVASLRNECKVLVKGFQDNHAYMAAAQRERLANAMAARSKATAGMLALAADRRNAARQMAESVRRGMVQALVASRKTLQEDVAQLRHGFVETRRVLRDDVQSGRQMWAARLSAAPGQAAQGAASGMSASGMFRTLRNALDSFTPSAPATEKPAERLESEDTAQPAKRWSQRSDEEKVLRVVQKHRKGISAAEIGEKVSLHAVVVGRIMKELIERGEARRDEATRLYFRSQE